MRERPMMAIGTRGDLVKDAAKARAIARSSGDNSNAWVREFVEGMEEHNVTTPELIAAVERFNRTPDMNAVTDRLRHVGVTLA